MAMDTLMIIVIFVTFNVGFLFGGSIAARATMPGICASGHDPLARLR
jgi:hypothetical protein